MPSRTPCSKLPSPAREILARALRPAARPDCELITIAEAQQVADALTEAGILVPDLDIGRGFSFNEPGSESLIGLHPVLPHDRAECTNE